ASIRRLYVELPGGASITYVDDTLTVTSGSTEVVVEKDGDVSINAAGNVKLESQGDISLDAVGNITLKAQQNVSVQGLGATLEGQGSATVKGPSISLNGLSSFNPA